MTDDLLALLVEVTSVSAANRALRKPLTLPRPTAPKEAPNRAPTKAETDAAYKQGIAVLARTARKAGGR